MSELKHPSVGVVWNLGERSELRCRPRQLTMVQNYKISTIRNSLTIGKDPPCRDAMHVKPIEVQTSSRWCGVVLKLAEGMPTQVLSRSLDHGSK
ncbi:hypothetical protein TNCV_2689061 [Trichonephila clavipes]|nr:hypothetical protein TNCV_2689061 [Trichonephila clavipes]